MFIQALTEPPRLKNGRLLTVSYMRQFGGLFSPFCSTIIGWSLAHLKLDIVHGDPDQRKVNVARNHSHEQGFVNPVMLDVAFL